MSNIAEEKYYEAFGLEMPEETGAGEKEQETADPAITTGQVTAERGEQEQETADPAQAETGSEDAEADEENVQTGEVEKDHTMDPAQRRENAARRRRQEQQAAIDQAVNAALQAERDRNAAALESFFSRAGLKNTLTGQPIKTMEEFEAWDKEYRGKQLENDLKAGKLTPEGLANAIGEHPAVKQAQALIAQNAEQQRLQQEQQAKVRIDAEIAEIGKIDPSIKSVDDLLRMPNAKEFYDLVKRGYSFKDAHYIVNREKLERARADAARQQVIHAAQSKDHLRANGNSRGSGAVAVPDADMEWFRTFNPNASASDIQAFYNRHYKK